MPAGLDGAPIDTNGRSEDTITTIYGLQDFVGKVTAIALRRDEQLLYRGHADHNYKLAPSVLREQRYSDNESRIIHELLAAHPAEFAQDRTTLDRLARMQHYALPTRLLDVTWNPLVALYFAVKDRCRSKDGLPLPGEVIAIGVNQEQVKYYDSDTVSCIANLAYLTKDEKERIDTNERNSRKFHRQKSIVRLLHAIRDEKPSFKPEIVPDHLRTVVCVKPKYNSPRILAQAGAFLIFGLAPGLDEAEPAGISVVHRIEIPDEYKPTILKDLDRVGINESTMFPEIDSAARYISKKI